MVDPRDLPEDARQYHPMSAGYPPPEGEGPEVPESNMTYVAIEGLDPSEVSDMEANRIRHNLGRFLVSSLGKEIEGVSVVGFEE